MHRTNHNNLAGFDGTSHGVIPKMPKKNALGSMANCFPGFCFANGHMLRDRNVWLKGWWQLCDVVVTHAVFSGLCLHCKHQGGLNFGDVAYQKLFQMIVGPPRHVDRLVRGTTDLIVGIAGCLLSRWVPGMSCGRGNAWNNAGIEFVCCDFLLIVGSAVLLFGCPHGRCKSNYIRSTWCGIDSRETSSFMPLIPPKSCRGEPWCSQRLVFSCLTAPNGADWHAASKSKPGVQRVELSGM